MYCRSGLRYLHPKPRIKVIIRALEIDCFRNIKSLSLKPDIGLNVIVGENGMGKTNLIEAIYMLTGAKSFRTSKDKNLINFESEIARIDAQITKQDNYFRLSVMMDKNPGSYRKGFIDGVDNGRAARIAGNFCAVVFSPDHLGLVKGSREGRRYFMDNAICNLYPGHIDNLYRYYRILDHRNKLLKSLKNNNGNDDNLLDVIDIQLSEYCEKVSTRRAKYVEGLMPLVDKFYDGISSSRERLKIGYESRAKTGEEYVKLLGENRLTDKRLGFTGVGVHRDDISISLSSLSAGNFASQGQQRSIVLSLKQAEAEYYRQITGCKPILLFDDVLSELDAKRQEYLLGGAVDFQTFFTSCDFRAFKKLPVKVFNMKDGEIIQ